MSFKRKKKLAIIVLGNRNSGKSSSWYEIFGKKIRTGVKKIAVKSKTLKVFVKNSSYEEMGTDISEEVFIRNASFEEYGDEIADFFDSNNLPKIIFCSVQYKEKGIRTINFLKDNGYYLYIQWLNPGYKDRHKYLDYLGFEKKFKRFGKFIIVSGKKKRERVQQIKNCVLRWISE